MSATSYPRIPYGLGNFERIREEGLLYVDKTRFLRPLEDHRHAFLVRPRRFGKTCWVGLLECYYDRTRAERFDTVFAGEKVLQGFLAAYFGLAQFFLLRSEVELAKGYADLVLEPFTARYPDMSYGYVIELKYIQRSARPAAKWAETGTSRVRCCPRPAPSFGAISATRGCGRGTPRYASSASPSSSRAGNSSPAKRWRPTPAKRRRQTEP